LGGVRMTKPQAPLKLKVLELCGFAAGPYCTRLLADFGADVVKIEPPGVGDEARSHGPFLNDVPNPETSGTFLYLNTDKKSVSLDLEHPDGREIFKRLAAGVDVLVEDRPPGDMKRLGLEYETLKMINPGLIMASITPFGQDGPYAQYKVYPLNTCHASGQGYMLPMNSLTLDREPVRGPGVSVEYDAGLSASVAIMAAVFWKRKTGKGQYIDISKQQSTLHLERSQLRRFVDTGKSPNRTGMGRLLESLVRCKDGNYVILILSSEKQWQGLFKAMGEPEWGAKEPFNSQAGRSANYPELRERLAAWAKKFSAEEVFEKVQAFRSACAPAYTAEQFYHSPQILEREYLTDVEHPVAGKLKHPGLPYKFSDLEERERAPAPRLGEHNDEILGRRLNYSRQDLVKLKQAGVI
jgi:crotonobetainyl-CoA:carnitine CoA-transferase CaiB-like acyl-CoA transferase